MPTRLLISVRSVAEARQALAGGTDILDVKEPNHGSLGRASLETIQTIVANIAGVCPISVALGELIEKPAPVPLAEITYQKVGLARVGRAGWIDAFQELRFKTRPSELVPVVYADADRAAGPSPFEVLAQAEAIGLQTLLIDTLIKDGRGLLHWMPIAVLRELARRSRTSGIALGLAGSITMEQIHEVLSLQPSILAVRGAACRGQRREQEVDSRKVEKLARAVHRSQTHGSTYLKS